MRGLMQTYNKILILCMGLLTAGSLIAQTIGNPIGTQGYKHWTLSASSNYSNIEIENQKMVVNKHLAKATFGAAPMFDLYLLGGASKLKVKFKPNPYDDQYRFTYGFGFQWELLSETKEQPVEIWLNAQAIRFQSKDTYAISGTASSSSKWFNAMEYDWRELNGAIGISLALKRMKIYAGGIGWMLQRLDEKREYWNEKWWGPDKETFQSGFWYGATGGVEFHFPQNYKVCIEAIALNRTNYQIMVGINQTKIYNW